MRTQLAPSILSCDPGLFRPAIEEMAAAGADWIHFDVMDGQFVPPITFGADLVASVAKLPGVNAEAHLMTLTPERHLEAFIAAGCRRIIFHAEATPHAHRLCQTLRSSGVQAGVALNPATPVSAIEHVLDVVDEALVMTVNPGWGGQEFIASCLEKISRLRTLAPKIDIEVDGGIDPQTLRQCRDAGANVFVAGSYVMRAPSIAAGLRELRSACDSS